MDRYYRTAVDLYVCSIRALEQRSMAFLIVQSFLVAGYVGLLVQDRKSLEIFMWGIIAIGIIICGSCFIAGKTTSLDASVWRSYMRMIEGTSKGIKPPWDYHAETYNKRACFFTDSAKTRLPGPTLWVWFPAVFLCAWLFAFIANFVKLQPPLQWTCAYLWYLMGILPIPLAGWYYWKRMEKEETGQKAEQ